MINSLKANKDLVMNKEEIIKYCLTLENIYKDCPFPDDFESVTMKHCKNKILDKNCNIYKQGKNWYCEIDNIKITINSYSITAHLIK